MSASTENVVIILGAGASRAAKAPLMFEFLEVAEDELTSGDDRSVMERVNRARLELRKAHSKAQLDTRNLESVFAAFELARQFGTLGALSAGEVSSLPDDMSQVIVRTLERRVKWKVERSGDAGHIVKLAPDAGSAAITQMIEFLVKAGRRVDVLSFNYDIALEVAFHNKGWLVDYGLNPQSQPNEQTVRLYKLHGSLNWRGCYPCGYIDTKHVSDLMTWASGKDLFLAKAAGLEASRMFSENPEVCSSCEAALIHPVIVPPTLGKSAGHERVRIIWQAAVKALAKAQRLAIVGYSWPSSDSFFHYLYSVGTIGDTFIRGVLVANPDDAARDRFRSLLGPEAKESYQFEAVRAEEISVPVIRKLVPLKR